MEDAVAIAERLGYPVVLRPAYTMGGAGGGLVLSLIHIYLAKGFRDADH